MSDKYQQTLFEDFKIEFVKRSRQRNMRIRVKNNLVTVSGPLTCGEKSMRAFLNQNLEWVEKVLNKQSSHTKTIERYREKYRHHLMLHGEWLPVQRSANKAAGKGWLLQQRDGILWFTPPDNIDDYPDADLLDHYLKQRAKPEILSRFAEFAPTLPFRYNRVFIRSQKTKWGTCSGKGNLSFNWRLIKCPYWVWDYLFVHELCHTIHFNHSKAFWELVDRHFPRRKEAEAWIKENGDVVFQL
ncbi:MAG: SprT family zinc-dependent metalloprotease [Balneolales bacterium]